MIQDQLKSYFFNITLNTTFAKPTKIYDFRFFRFLYVPIQLLKY